MSDISLNRIERDILTLSRKAQLTLLERIIHRLRITDSEKEQNMDAQLEAMAYDPEIRMELESINEEFSGTQMDGLN